MKIASVNPNFFVVKVSKEDKKRKSQHNGKLYLSPSFIFGTQGMQCGEIIAIGKLAKLVIPNAKIGGTLIFSWKVEYAGGDDQINLALIEEDEEFYYYTVTISEYKGRDTETYAYFDGNTITTHPSFVILEKKKEESNELVKSESGLFLFSNYTMTPSEIQQKIEFNKQHIYSISNSVHSFEAATKEQIYKLEQENRKLTKMLQGEERYEKYKVIYSNPLLDVEPNEEVFAWNIFCLEEVTINDNTYVITKHKHIGCKTL